MIYSRISARAGQVVRLNTSFFRGGVLTDPYAIRQIDIYRNHVSAANLLTTIKVDDPWATPYPYPVAHQTVNIPAGQCGTGPQNGAPETGRFYYDFTVPCDAVVPDVYFDVWTYFPDNPIKIDVSGGWFTGTDPSAITDWTNSDGVEHAADLDSKEWACLLQRSCNQFWAYPDQWFSDDGLETVRFGFEPIDQRFRQPEVRNLEIGLMPLPLYEYNFNLVNPIIPYLTGTITVKTQHNELLVDKESLSIGLRQGNYRSNPYVLRWSLDTSRFLIGTYVYRVTLTLPDGSTRTSPDFNFVIQ